MEKINDVKVTPELIIAKLKKKDVILSYDEAAQIIDFFFILAKIAVKHYRGYEES